MSTRATTKDNTDGITAIAGDDVRIHTAGVIAFWRLQGGLDLVRLGAAWEAAGLPGYWLPEAPSAAVALRRAVNELRAPDRLIRSLKAGGYALVQETEVGGELNHRVLFKVAIDKVGRLTFTERAGDTAADRAKISADYLRFQDELIQADVSPWLCRVMDRLEAVALRDTGGIYFVPRFTLTKWNAIVDALREATAHVIAQVPALKSDEAASAVIDAVKVETAKTIGLLSEAVNNTDLGPRALGTKISETEAAMAKLAGYEKLFDAKLDGVRGELEKLRAGLTVAMFKAQAEDEDAAE